MACSIIRDKETGNIVQVLAPNGENSYLFEAALKAFSGNREEALRAWATVYTTKYKLRYGDWEKGESFVNLDPNGEPQLDTVLHTPESIAKTVTTRFANWQQLQPGEDGFVPRAKAEQYRKVLMEKLPGVKIKLVTSHLIEGHAKLIYETSYKDLSTKFSREEIKAQKQEVNKIMDYLVAKLPGVEYQWVKASSLKQEDHYWPIAGVRAFVRNNQIFLVEGKVLPQDGIEEVMHVFVESLRKDRPALFKGLIDALKEDPKYAPEFILIRDWYKKRFPRNKDLDPVINSEFLAKQLAKAMKAELELNPEGRPTSKLGKLIQRFLDWITELFNAGAVSADTTLKEIAGYINSKDVHLPIPENEYMYYSAEEVDPNANFDPDDRDAVDQTFNVRKTARELNIEKGQKELVKLDKIRGILVAQSRFGSNVAQIAVIDKLIDNVKQKIALLEAEESTIGVTKYKGSRKVENIDEKATKLGAGFGTFFHNLLEEVQDQYMETGDSPSILYSKSDFFENFYQKNKELILFNNVDKEMLKEIGTRLISKLDNITSEGKILLPEISIAVTDINGITVIGRLDLLAINKEGKVEVIDLKTKKAGTAVKKGTFPGYDFTAPRQVQGAYEDGVDSILAEFRNKSAIDDYQMQLGIYAEMLEKIGIPVTARTIYAVAYSVGANQDKTEFTLTGYGVNTYGTGDFTLTSGPKAVSIDNAVRSRFRDVAQGAEEEGAKGDPNNPFNSIDMETQQRMIDKFSELVDRQLDAMEKEKRSIEQDENISKEQANEKKTRLAKRQANLISIKSKIESKDPSANNGLLVKAALEVFKSEIATLNKRIKEVEVPQVYELGNELHQQALKLIQGYTQDLDNISEYLELFGSTVTSMDIEQTAKEDLLKYLGDMRIQAATASSEYIKVSKGVIKAIITKTIGTEKWGKVFGDMRKVLGPRLNWLRKTVDDIESGRVSEDNLGYKTLRVVAGIFGRSNKNQGRLEALKEEIVKIEKLIQTNELNDKTLDAYLSGIVDDPNSAFYMGSTMGTSMMGINMSDLIGSNVDSELIVSAMFQYMRNLTEEGRLDVLNWADDLSIDKLKNDFIESAGGIAQANEIITEQVQVVQKFDEEGKAVETETYSQYVAPFSNEFETDRNRFQSKLNDYRIKIKDINKQIKEAPTEEDKKKLQEKRKELQKEQEEVSLAFVKWEIEETTTQLKPEVYMLKRGSGAYSDRVSELYQQNQAIIVEAGGAEYLDAQQQEIIDANEAEVSRIRQEMLEEQPELAEKFDKLLEYFETDLNYGLWTKLREEIIAQGNPAQLAQWDLNNSVMAPTEEFQQRVDDIYERMSEISSQDPQLEEYRNQLRAIRAKSKVRGKFNYKYLTDEDAQLYSEIDKKIEDRQKELYTSGEMSQDISELMKSYINRLNSIRSKQLNPAYVKERNRLRKNVEQAYGNILTLEKELRENPEKLSQLAPQILEAQREYTAHENIFAAFFNKNNKSTYEVGMDIIALRKDIKEDPKGFLYEYVPANPADMELVPNKNYKFKRLKDSAYNPEYGKSFVKNRFGPGMQPMPKGIKFNPVTNEFDITPGARYVNPKFVKMMSNPAARSFYKTWIVQEFLLKQKLASGQPLGFNLPFVKQLALENVINKGVAGIGREYKEKVQELAYGNSKYEQATNESGMAGAEKIIFPENQRMPANLTTTNGIEAIVNWNNGYYRNRKMATVNLEMTAVLDFVDNQIQQTADPDLKAKLGTIKDLIEFNKKKFVHGQVYEREKAPGKIFNRKNARILMGAAAFGRMAFDIPMQVGNLLSGNVQAFLSLSSSRYADTSDYIAAKRMLYTRFLPAMLGDYGKISDVSMESKIYRIMNPLSKDLNRMFDANTVSKLRRLANRVFSFGDLSMAIQDKGEFEIGMTMMLMIMNHQKYEVFETDSDGNVLINNGVPVIKKNADGSTVYVNAIEVWAMYDGKIGLRKDVNVTMDQINTLKGTIMSEIYRFQGNYAGYTKTKFGSTLLGTLYEFYRKYLVPAISVRFSSGGFEGIGSAYSWDAPEAYTGTYVALGRMFQYYGLGQATKTLLYDTLLPGFVKNNVKFDSEIEGYYRGRAAMAGREIMIAIAALMLYNALRNLMQDSDEDDLTALELMGIRSLVKMSNESRSMVPLPVVGKPADYIDQFAQFTGALREGKTLWELTENSLYYADYAITGSEYAYERGFYQRDTDRYMAGDPKVFKNTSDILGISNVKDVFYPYEAAKRATKPK